MMFPIVSRECYRSLKKNSSKQKSSVIHFMNAIHHFWGGGGDGEGNGWKWEKQTVVVLQLPEDWGILP